MDQKNIQMFVSTCNYLNTMVEEILASGSDIPPNVILTLNELMSKLFIFMNHCYKTDKSFTVGKTVKKEFIDNGVVSNLPKVQSDGPMEPSACSQSHTDQDLLLHSSDESTQLSNLNIKSEFDVTQTILNNFTASTSSGKCHMDDFVECVQSTSKFPIQNIMRADTSSKPNDLATAIENNIPVLSDFQTTSSVISGPSECKSNSSMNNEDIKLDRKLSFEKSLKSNGHITKIFSGYIDTILEGVLKSDNMGIFCMICNLLCLTSWTDHANEAKHIEKASHLKSSMMCSCRICRICIYGTRSRIVPYFKYHHEKLHSLTEIMNWKECLIVVESTYSSESISASSSISNLSTTSVNKPHKRTRKKNKGNGNSTEATSTDSLSKNNQAQTDHVHSNISVAKPISPPLCTHKNNESNFIAPSTFSKMPTAKPLTKKLKDSQNLENNFQISYDISGSTLVISPNDTLLNTNYDADTAGSQLDPAKASRLNQNITDQTSLHNNHPVQDKFSPLAAGGTPKKTASPKNVPPSSTSSKRKSNKNKKASKASSIDSAASTHFIPVCSENNFKISNGIISCSSMVISPKTPLLNTNYDSDPAKLSILNQNKTDQTSLHSNHPIQIKSLPLAAGDTSKKTVSPKNVPPSITSSKPKSNKNKKASKASSTDSAASTHFIPVSPYPNFDIVLMEMLKKWNETSIKLDGGFCTICDLGILSSFDWFTHTEEHMSKEPLTFKEAICGNCNIKIFGVDQQKYFDLPGHIELDKIFMNL